jgi:hypothetical protein
MGSQVLTLVAIFLPLSAMWASSSVDNATQPASAGPSGRKKVFGLRSFGSGGGSPCKASFGNRGIIGLGSVGGDDKDAEKGLTDGIVVERQVSVASVRD